MQHPLSAARPSQTSLIPTFIFFSLTILLLDEGFLHSSSRFPLLSTKGSLSVVIWVYMASFLSSFCLQICAPTLAINPSVAPPHRPSHTHRMGRPAAGPAPQQSRSHTSTAEKRPLLIQPAPRLPLDVGGIGLTVAHLAFSQALDIEVR